MSMNTPNALQAAQAVTFFKGQETQNSESTERKEQERLLTQQLQQAKQQMRQTQTAPGAQEGGGFLA